MVVRIGNGFVGWLLISLSACDAGKVGNSGGLITDGGLQGETDGDGDGVPFGEDCDDADATTGPGATEVCDGVDNDCDGEIDEDALGSWYPDVDGDGFGDEGGLTLACEPPAGMVAVGGDCADEDPTIFPDAAEDCDSLDNDCDGEIDEGLEGSFYADADGDGFGDPETSYSACDAPFGAVTDASDCDDSDAGVAPGAEEVCDEQDNNCDGTVDEGVTEIWYADRDLDGWGVLGESLEACAAPMGYSALGGDCADADPAINPGASEICNDTDDDCDGLIDDHDDSLDASTAETWYVDGDGDGYGDPAAPQLACDLPSGMSANNLDCLDSLGAVNPAASEICNGLDDDCDGATDDADASLDRSSGSAWYADDDGDLYGDAADVVLACLAPSGRVATAGDCDDLVLAVNPAASEVCNGRDDDCDGAADDADASLDLSSGNVYYGDVDNDGFGWAGSPMRACVEPAGAAGNALDCDDGAAGVNPGEVEVCSGVDEDCDGLVDDADPGLDHTTGTLFYDDGDGDLYGDPASGAWSCLPGSGQVANAGDCDDAQASVHPGASEVCNGQDDDCDALTDDADASVDLSTGSAWYQDGDGDTWGGLSLGRACGAPVGGVELAGDCDDGNATIYPGAPETWYDGVDSDCDGAVDPDPCVGLPGATSIAEDATCTTTFPSSASWSVVEEWGTRSRSWSVGTGYVEIMATPAVGQLNDDTGDGVIDDDDVPDVVFTTFTGSSYSSAGYLRAVSGQDGSELWSSSGFRPSGTSTTYSVAGAAGVAIADLDADGSPEVLTMSSGARLMAFEADGTGKWVSNAAAGSSYGMPTVGDLDGDGLPEIMSYGTIFDWDGTLIRTLATSGVGTGFFADVDLDGRQEVVVGNKLYEYNGTLAWTAGSGGEGTSAVADLDSDGQAEILNHTGGYLYAYQHTGALLWSINLADGGNGAPCVADFDGDGEAEIAVAGATRISVVNHDGTRRWYTTIQDGSSSRSGCSAFDFDADGAAELAYADEYELFIFDGASGAELWSTSDHASGTLWEYPVISDVDNDGQAELVVPNNNYARPGVDGLTVYGAEDAAWPSARKQWNEFSYSVGNINEDGSLPGGTSTPWSAHNSFRAQVGWGESIDSVANLSPTILGICEECALGGFELYVALDNTGAVFAPAETLLAVFAVDGSRRTLLDVVEVGAIVHPGERSAPVSFGFLWSEVGTDGLEVVVDEDGFGSSAVRECDEYDNLSAWEVESACP